MKKYIAVALAAMLTLAAPVSGFAAVKLQTHKKIYNTSKYNDDLISYSTGNAKMSKKTANGKEYLKVEINYPCINGYSSSVTSFNNANRENARNLLNEYVAAYTKEAKLYYNTNKFAYKKDYVPYTLKVDYSMMYNENSVVSVLYTTTTTVGGVDTVQYSAHNYDLVTGKELTPDDVSLIPTKGETLKLAAAEFNRKMVYNESFYKDVDLKPEDISFYFEDDAIVFFVNPGVIAPEDRGIVTYRIIDDAARTYLLNKVK